MALVLELISDLKNAPQVKEAGRTYQAFIEEYGYKSYMYGLFPIEGSPEIANDFLWYSTHSVSALEALSKLEMQYDVSIQHCISKSEPFWWYDTIPYLKAKGTDVEGEITYAKASAKLGFGKGVSIPLQVHRCRKGGVGLARDAHEPDSEHRKIWGVHHKEIEISAWIFHLTVDPADLAKTFFRLSPREHDVLLYSAAGLSQKRIAVKLVTHIRTVEDQLSSARKKMNAATTSEAVAKAVWYGLVSP